MWQRKACRRRGPLSRLHVQHQCGAIFLSCMTCRSALRNVELGLQGSDAPASYFIIDCSEACEQCSVHSRSCALYAHSPCLPHSRTAAAETVRTATATRSLQQDQRMHTTGEHGGHISEASVRALSRPPHVTGPSCPHTARRASWRPSSRSLPPPSPRSHGPAHCSPAPTASTRGCPRRCACRGPCG